MARIRHKRPKRSNSGLYVAMLVLAGGLVALIVIARRMNLGAEEAAAAARREKESQVDPFADVPEEKPPPPRGAKLDADGNVDPFGDAPPDLLNEKMWRTSLALIEEARALRKEAENHLEHGENDEAKQVGLESRRRYEQALEYSREWCQEQEQLYGPHEPQVRKMMGLRATWRRELQAIRKNARV